MKIDTVSRFQTFLVLGSISAPPAGPGMAFAEGNRGHNPNLANSMPGDGFIPVIHRYFSRATFNTDFSYIKLCQMAPLGEKK